MEEKENQDNQAEAELRQWQIDHIKDSIKQAAAGQFISHEDVKKMAAKWRRRG